jgi:hypothetical protein
MSGDNWKQESTVRHLKNKAEKALELAKELEAKQLLAGKKLVQIDKKTIVLR